MIKQKTGTNNLVSVILNVAYVAAFIACLFGSPFCAETATSIVISAKRKFSDHANVRFTSQMINDISSVLQKLLKYFSDTTISTFFSTIINVIIIWCFSCNSDFAFK